MGVPGSALLEQFYKLPCCAVAKRCQVTIEFPADDPHLGIGRSKQTVERHFHAGNADLPSGFRHWTTDWRSPSLPHQTWMLFRCGPDDLAPLAFDHGDGHRSVCKGGWLSLHN